MLGELFLHFGYVMVFVASAIEGDATLLTAAYLARRGRETSAPPALLHVANGESAGNTLRQTGLGGAVLPWQDVLHEGPVPDVARAELLQVRAKFLSECGWGRRGTLRSSLQRRDRQLLEALRANLQVVLWFEHDLYDQLQLLDVLALAHGLGGSLESIVVGAFPGKPSFRGLGELAPDELETLWPARRDVSAETLVEAADAWAAFRAPDPVGLAQIAARGSEQLPFLPAALERLLEELPGAADGLSRTERLTLQAVAGGARAPFRAFLATQELEEAPFLGDAWFYSSLSALGQGDTRLLETEEGAPLPAPPPLSDGQEYAGLALRVTASGERVLEGEADRVELLGVDRWLGGSHVTAESGWRWDSAVRQLTA